MPDVDDELIWKGPWASAQSYDELDAVSSGASVYVCTVAHTSAGENAPPNDDFWELAAEAAIGDAYASVTDYRTFIGKTSTSNDLEIARDLAAGARFIERYLHGRNFNKDASPVARVYMPKTSNRPRREDWAESENPWLYGGGARGVDIDDLVSVSAITVDENRDNTYSRTLTADDYELLPRNAALGAEVKPYNRIELTSWGTVHSFGAGARVKVTGIFGWPGVPEVIRLANIKWTAIMRNEGPDATGRQIEFDQVIQQSDEGRRIAYLLMRAYNDRVTF